jgi:hypothetical protein
MENDELMYTKTSLEFEINTYRRLLNSTSVANAHANNVKSDLNTVGTAVTDETVCQSNNVSNRPRSSKKYK